MSKGKSPPNKKIIEPGTRFGHLIFVRELPERGKDWKVLCEWLCDCGNTHVAVKQKVVGGKTKSCGCGRQLIIEPGTVYNRLRFVRQAGIEDGATIGEWICECGKVCIIKNSEVMNGNVGSCGCSRRTVSANPGDRFGRLVYIREVDKSNRGERQWLCHCDCGNAYIGRNDAIVRGDVRSCGCLYDDHHKSRRITKEEKKRRLNEHKKSVYQRSREFTDGYKSVPCSRCGGSFPPICMDFNHLEPEQKSETISRMSRKGYTLDEILAEIEKCEVVCACCHRLITREQSKSKGVKRGVKKELSAFVDGYKAAPCADCGQLFASVCMDLDHIESETKTANVSNLVNGCQPKEVILSEIRKCEPVCACCHRLRTEKRRLTQRTD